MTPKDCGRREFVALMACLMSVIALTIDAMLPALGEMGQALGVTNPNHPQLIVSSIFLGMAVGQLFFGPFSDSYGRKKSIYLGMVVYLVGSIVCLLALDLRWMLIGRLLQGLGAASTRVVSMAMIRDRFEGREMAQIMSLIMIIFILVPAIAPSLGQLILFVADWRMIFGVFIIVCVSSTLWLHLRQAETLPVENRLKFSVPVIISGTLETIKNPIAMGYTVGSGLASGGFIGYLSSSQQILQVQYGVGNLFSIYFGSLAISVGLASFTNSRLVMKLGMEKLCIIALIIWTTLGALFYFYASAHDGNPHLNTVLAYLFFTFFCFGILLGNFNAMAVQPLGHIAGVANSVIASVQTLIGVAIGGYIGHLYNGTITPLVSGFFLSGLSALIVTVYTMRFREAPSS